ncbi:DUF2163 domain-containing protein [Oryzibacter oryziterrae]|uniref:DUF2163 domain-containing protein n=1 Tax=Oryzibacter oryziterrae TaxID=2766474 RepID=UPI001F20E02A|nr:DUF2163 domain-containing protein [Oryzibacter oryziterrae]
MRTLPAGLAAHLAGEATTLCSAWIVTRKDGVLFGFTDHDRRLTVAGVTCEPATGFDRSAASRGAGFAVGEEEIAGALSSDLITEADLAAGLWDGATIRVYLVNWQSPGDALLQRTGVLGEVVASDGGFRAEVRGPTHLIDQPRGRLFSRGCDANFGDSRCKLALGSWRTSATVAAGSDDRVIYVSGISGFSADWFGRGTIAFTSGALAGKTAPIDEHLDDAAGIRLLLRAALPAVPATGDSVTLTAGCDKRFETCRDRFANHENFRGFPHMPGKDFVFSYARGNGTDTGEVLF